MRQKTIIILLFMLGILQGVKAQTGNWSDEGNRDTSWGSNYDSATSFIINDAKDLAQFAYLVNNGKDFSGKTVAVSNTSNLQLGDHYWAPIGTPENPFNGTFDGAGREIYEFNITGSANYQGFFGYVGAQGTVKNVVTVGTTIAGGEKVGTVAGYNAGTVQNCIASYTTVTGTSYAGAVIGQNIGTASGCYSVFTRNSIKALGVDGSSAGEDVDGKAQGLFTVEGDDITVGFADGNDNDANVSIGSPTGTRVGSITYYDDGIQYNFYHFYKTGATFDITSNMQGYNVVFGVSGEGATISGNTVTVGTENMKISVVSKTATGWDGTGTEDDPYIIANREQMDQLANRVNGGENFSGKFFTLTTDLNYDYVDGVRTIYTPVGNAENPFSGTFDGNGHEIKYAGIDGAGDYHGLFGYNNGTIKNIMAASCDIIGSNYVGVIAGYNAGTIENCRVNYRCRVLTGEADASLKYYGGVAGYNAGTVKTTVSEATMAEGYDVDNNIRYTIGTLTQAGGVVGYNAAGATVEHCLYLGDQLLGTGYVGAVAGQNAGTLTGNYYHNNNCDDDESGDNVGTTVLGAGANGNITGADAEGAAKAKAVSFQDDATVEGDPIEVTANSPYAKHLSVYADGLLFDDTFMGDSKQLAFYTTAATVNLALAEELQDGQEVVFNCYDDGTGASVEGNVLTLGSGDVVVSAEMVNVPKSNSWLHQDYRAAAFSNTGENTITIMSAAEMGLLAYNVNYKLQDYSGYTITLGADIDMSGHIWESMGNTGVSGSPMPMGFKANFDGAGKTISNMDVTNAMGAGLFGIVSGNVTVQNITIDNATVKGGMYSGIIAGINQGTITNCHVKNSTLESFVDASSLYPLASGRYIGGITGFCENGTVSGCTVMETTIGSDDTPYGFTGGIVGGLQHTSTTTSYVKDNLFCGTMVTGVGSESFGAISGMNVSTIQNNYYTGTGLYGIDGRDYEEGNSAVRAYGYNEEPAGIGTAGTAYGTGSYVGVTPYTNGLLYDGIYYTTEVPTGITLYDGADNTAIINANNGLTTDVTIKGRTLLKNDVWNTLCLPFSLSSLDGTPLEGATVRTLDSSSFNGATGTLTLDFCEDLTSIEAGKPYIVKWASGDNITDPVFQGVTIDNKAMTDVETDAVTFKGIYDPYTIGIPNAVASFDASTNTLTFKMSTEAPDGTTSWDASNTGEQPGWINATIPQNIKRVVFEPSFAKARPTSCSQWFNNMNLLESIDGMQYLNTSEVTDMSGMFTTLYYLGSVDVSHFNTEKVQDMSLMFYACPFRELDLSSFNTANVTDMSYMFSTCVNLETVYVSDKWTTDKVTAAENMFNRTGEQCGGLIGGQGTECHGTDNIGIEYARVDGGTDAPGYFTYKAAPAAQSNADESDSEDSDNTMLYMGAGNTLYYPNGAMTIGAFRGYFRLADGLVAGEPTTAGAQGVKAFVLNFDEDATSIEAVDPQPSTLDAQSSWYTIDGRRLNGKPMQKGVYINNGKKIFIK